MSGAGEEWDPLIGDGGISVASASPVTPTAERHSGARGGDAAVPGGREVADDHQEPAVRPIYLDEIVEEDMTEVRDFCTIDWALFAEHDRERTSLIRAKYKNEPPIVWMLHMAYESSQGWVALTIIGFLSGLLAAMVGIATDWMTDVKHGICSLHRGWWLTKEVCCADAGPGGCENWLSWHGFLVNDADASTLLLVTYATYIAAAVIMAVLSSFMVVSLAPYAAGSGISEMKVILGGFVIKKFLGVLTLLVKSVGLILSVGAGMNVGKEGPFVHTSACCANVVSRFFPKYRSNEAKKRELLSCAAAAGVAVAFGAPIGGVLFSLEEVSTYFPVKTMWRAFYCAMVAAISISSLNGLSGKLVMFEITYHHKWHLFELIPFSLIGIAGGAIGALIIRANASVCSFRRTSKLKQWPITEVGLVCAITSAIHFPIVFLRDAATTLLEALFSDCGKEPPVLGALLCLDSNRWDLAGILIASAGIKIVLLVFTFGTKVPGGIFIPSLCTGALFGRAVGIAMEELHHWAGDSFPFEECASVSICIHPPIYAIVGGAAVLGGMTRMTVSLVVIMIEVTGGMAYVIPIMLGVIFAKIVGDAFSPNTIYLEAIRAQGYPLLDHKTKIVEDAAQEQTAADVLAHTNQGEITFAGAQQDAGGGGGGGIHSRRGGLYVVRLMGETVGSIDDFLHSNPFHGFPVVWEQNAPVGYIRRSIMVQVMDEALVDLRVNHDTPVVFSDEAAATFPRSTLVLNLGRWMDKGATIVLDRTPFEKVTSILLETGIRYLLVVKDGALKGIIKKKDVLEYVELYEKAARRAAQEDEEEGR